MATRSWLEKYTNSIIFMLVVGGFALYLIALASKPDNDLHEPHSDTIIDMDDAGSNVVFEAVPLNEPPRYQACELKDEPGRVVCNADCAGLWKGALWEPLFLMIWTEACGPLKVEMADDRLPTKEENGDGK